MTNDLYILSIVGVFGFFLLVLALITGYLLTWAIFSPIHLSKRWYLSITKEGILDNAFGYKRFYPWMSIRSHEIKQVRIPTSDRFKHDLILKLESATAQFPLHKYGIDTESEASNFMLKLESYLPAN